MENDQLIAERLRKEMCAENELMECLIKTDETIALFLQEEVKDEEVLIANSRIQYQNSLLKEPEAIAFDFVSKIVSLAKCSNSVIALGGSVVAVDDLHPMTVDFVAKRNVFLKYKSRIGSKVEIFHHYTNSNDLNSIRVHGLMSSSERRKLNISSVVNNGAALGDGVYVALDDKSSSGYGDTLLICGIIRGKQQNNAYGKKKNICNLTSNGSTWMVLHDSSHVVPLIQIPKANLSNYQISDGHLGIIRQELMKTINETFNHPT